MAIQVTNRVVAPAFPGQGVIITLDSTDSAELANIAVGDTATVSSTGRTGTVRRVDAKGHTFLVKPVQPDKKFDSVATGKLSDSETITIS